MQLANEDMRMLQWKQSFTVSYWTQDETGKFRIHTQS